ncbi:response regulator [Ectothiorhodospiraceae bacterium WFHF3C12]|nr:response regulator [Ectothiorhodospiraceae bacterium WFHF3C12]
MSHSPAIVDAWRDEDRAARVRFSKIGCVLAILLIPAGSTLDFMVYPSLLGDFLVYRLLADAVIAAILALHFTEIGRRHIRALILGWLITPQVIICYMIFLTEGFGSTYYAGLNLAILGMGILLPVTVWELGVLALVTLGLYCWAGLAHAGAPEFGATYNNVYFLIATSVISGTAVYFNRRRRYSEFSLNFELNSRNKELAELDRVKSEFFANVSHELRTPLTLILAPLERLLHDHRNLPERVTDTLDVIRQNGLRLLRLVNDLLEVIRLEEGRVELDRHTLRLDSLLGGVVDAMSHLAEARGIEFHKRTTTSPVWIRGDRGALEKVFFNVLSNAIKFTNPGGSVTVSSHVSGDAMRVSITDTGIGMSKESLPYVFDRFRQGDSSATRKYPGTGLGLALVKELTERHGGHAELTSALGEGTTVTVTLPIIPEWETIDPETEHVEPEGEESSSFRWLDLAAERGAIQTPRAKASEAEHERRPVTQSGTVLIVDDEPDMRHYLIDLLQDEYRVLVARDGREGLELAERDHPELMVLDLMLPEIDGLEVCHRIKQNTALRATRIVLLTARADESSKLVALENGADDFLTKPFSGIEVQTRLRNLRRSRELEHDLETRNEELQHTLTELTETQNKLVHSEKLNALGRLSAGLLHEINNPLNYTLTALEMAKIDPAVEENEELRDTLGDIDDGMQRIRNIVKELRAFAYPSKGEQGTFDIGEAIDGALQIMAHESRGVHIDNQVERGWQVTGSRNHVTQVLVNLLSNALKAVHSVTDSREGELRIRGQVERGRVYISVRDNGTGIPQQALAQIFDPFYTTRDVGEGMGMGLSICQTIIRNHGGELLARSEEDSWTEFTFDLALAESESEQAGSEAEGERLRNERTA